MVFKIAFNEEKNQLLKAIRGISFDEVISAIENNGLLADIAHPNHKHAHQRVYVVKIGNYAYAVPYVINQHEQEIFLKTVFPSRALTKKYLKGFKNE